MFLHFVRMLADALPPRSAVLLLRFRPQDILDFAPPSPLTSKLALSLLISPRITFGYSRF